MPATSRKQQQAMAIAEQIKKGKQKATPGTPSAKMAKSMSIKQLKDFASTSTKGLPIKKGKRK